jgi:hypothetical protein
MKQARAKAGQPLEKTPCGSASFQNKLVDLVDSGNKNDLMFRPLVDQPAKVMVSNNTGQHLPVFSILQLDEPLVKPGRYTDPEFKFNPAVKGIEMPEDVSKAFCVIQTDAEPKEVVEAVIVGFTIGFVDVKDEEHEFCEPIEGVTKHFESRSSGRVRIHWKEAGEGIKKAQLIISSDPIEDNLMFLQTVSTILTEGQDITIPLGAKYNRGELDVDGIKFEMKADHVLNVTNKKVWFNCLAIGQLDPPGSDTQGEIFTYDMWFTHTVGGDDDVVVPGSDQRIEHVISDAVGVDEVSPSLNFATHGQGILDANGKIKLKINSTHTNDTDTTALNFTIKIWGG